MTGSMLFSSLTYFLGTQIVCPIETWRQLVNNAYGIRINEIKWLPLNSTVCNRMVWISVTVLWQFYVFLFAIKTWRDDLWVFLSNEKHWKEAGIDNGNIKGRTKFQKSFHLCSWFAVYFCCCCCCCFCCYFPVISSRHWCATPVIIQSPTPLSLAY